MTTTASKSSQNRPVPGAIPSQAGHQTERGQQKGRFARWLGGLGAPKASPPAPTTKKAPSPYEDALSGPAPTPPGRFGVDDERARQARQEGEGREPGAEPAGREAKSEAELLDPLQRVLWQEGPWARPDVAPGASSRPALAPALPAPTLEALVDRFLRRVAFSGGRQRGVAHLEIGAGELAGARLTISAEGDEVDLLLDAPPGVDAEPYRARLCQRFEAKGLRAHVRVR